MFQQKEIQAPEILAPFGPLYPVSLGVAVEKFRRNARRSGGLKSWDKTHVHAYGDAVEKSILAMQRSAMKSGLPPINPKCNCASGTPYPDGADIHEAVRRQQRNALLNCAASERRLRWPHVWQELYEEAMESKHAQQPYALKLALERQGLREPTRQAA